MTYRVWFIVLLLYLSWFDKTMFWWMWPHHVTGLANMNSFLGVQCTRHLSLQKEKQHKSSCAKYVGGTAPPATSNLLNLVFHSSKQEEAWQSNKEISPTTNCQKKFLIVGKFLYDQNKLFIKLPEKYFQVKIPWHFLNILQVLASFCRVGNKLCLKTNRKRF